MVLISSMTTITLDTVPPSLNSAYKKYRNRVVLSQRAKDFKQLVLESAPEGLEPMQGPIKMEVSLQFRGGRKRDLDNYLKVLIDALKGVYFGDDDQIYEVRAKKGLRSQEDKVEVAINPITIYES